MTQEELKKQAEDYARALGLLPPDPNPKPVRYMALPNSWAPMPAGTTGNWKPSYLNDAQRAQVDALGEQVQSLLQSASRMLSMPTQEQAELARAIEQAFNKWQRLKHGLPKRW